MNIYTSRKPRALGDHHPTYKGTQASLFRATVAFKLILTIKSHHTITFPSLSHSLLSSQHSLITPKIPLESSKFTLDSSGIAGFFGGEWEISAMGTVYLIAGRRWLGWYNLPGSYQMAVKCGQIAKSRLWDGLFLGPDIDPVTLFGLGGTEGPMFMALDVGYTISHTSHVAHLISRFTKELLGTHVQGRVSVPYGVTIMQLNDIPSSPIHPPHFKNVSHLAYIPIGSSLFVCVACAVFQDWYRASMILLGMFCSGLACLVIGSGSLVLEYPASALKIPGYGILMADTQVTVLQVSRNAVSCIIRGKFSLHFRQSTLR